MKLKCFFKLHLFFFFCVVTAELQAQKIGFLIDSYVTERWYTDQKMFIEKVKSLGGEVQVEIAYGDPLEQTRLSKKMIADGVKVLVVVPTDARKAIEIVDEAKKAHVPVISYDRLILSNDVTIYVSFNNEKIGEMQAQYALNKVPTGKYLILSGPESDNNALQFRAGQYKTLQPFIDNGTIKLLGDLRMGTWGEIGALVKVDEFLSSSTEKPDVVIATNDALASGTIQALPKESRGKVLVTGMDADVSALRLVLSGSQAMTIYKPIKPLAYLAAETAIKLAKGQDVKGKIRLRNGDVEVDAILLEPITVDKTNIQETVIKDGHVTTAKLEDRE